MEQFIQTISNLIVWIKPATYILVAAALVVNGIILIWGGQEGKEKAKKALPAVVIGGILIVGAISFGTEIVAQFAF